MKRNIWLAFLAGWLCWLPAAQAQDANRGYINAREFADAQGIAYQWFPMQKMLVLSKGTRLMRLVIDQPQAVVDNQPLTLPSPPKIEDGQVMVPARSIIQVFGVATNQQPPPPAPPGVGPGEETGDPTTVVVDPPPPAETPVSPPSVEVDEPGAILLQARHSRRDDQTRVVLEFDGTVAFTSESPGSNKFKLRVSGCKNLIPTKRSNPVGRDIKGVSYNSGPNRKGLVVSFDLPEGGKQPLIETVADPFRIVLTFSPPPGTIIGSGTATLVASGTPLASGPLATPKPPVKGASSTLALASAPSNLPPTMATDSPKIIQELAFDVPLASLSRSIFQGRAIIIDPGHGGPDKGAVVNGLPPEKEITLAIGLELHRTLKKMGFNSYLVRSGDTEILPNRRQAIINKAGGDLLVSIHLGASQDDSQDGIACYWYDSRGVNMEVESSGKLSAQLVFNEWVQSTRFDLAKFLALKVGERLSKHLEVHDRGAQGLPLLPLQFLSYPAMVVEVGMLTHPQEGPKIASKGFQVGAGKAIANGIVDFFNGIRLNP